MIDFQTIAAAALGQAESLLASWLPAGRKSGREWLARNPTRADGKPGSFSVNLTTGKWADFATGDKGGDLVSLLAYLKGCSQKEAAETLAAEIGLSGSRGTPFRPSRVSATRTRQEKPIRAKIEPPTCDPDFRHWEHGLPPAKWAYRDEDGIVISYACPFDFENEEKEVKPLSWNGTAWRWKAQPEPRLIYNLPELLSRPEDVAVVAEGEKAATAVSELLPEAVATTWPGGCKVWDRADWTPLTGRKVVLWPDAVYGIEAMTDLKAHLLETGAASVVLPTLPVGLPKTWDAADALAEGWDRSDVLRLLAGRFTAPPGLCPLCWLKSIAAPIEGPTCSNSGYTVPDWTPEEIQADGRDRP